jgi:RimJ/RimL family protein N-acetyltransferase
MTDLLTERTFETSRLILRRLTLADTDNLLGILSDPVAMRYYPQTYSREETEGWITRTMAAYEKYGHGFYACILKESGEFAGICGVLHQLVDDIEEKEVGYLFLRKFWGHGYATEAAAFWMNYAFTEMGRTRIISLIVPENLPSRRVAERNGLAIEKRTTFKEFTFDVWHLNKP